MEPGLSGLQSETSSCIALCLILRAHKLKGGADEAVKRPQNHDYVYSVPVIEPVSPKNIAANSILFDRGCLSDSLLVAILHGGWVPGIVLAFVAILFGLRALGDSSVAAASYLFALDRLDSAAQSHITIETTQSTGMPRLDESAISEL
jgi:hypothetical protein